MKLNIFNTVNNEEQERGQQSVVLLKHSQPCLHHLHVLSTLDHSFTPIHPSPPYFSTEKSVGQVPSSFGVGAHGWRVPVSQPWGHNSV